MIWFQSSLTGLFRFLNLHYPAMNDTVGELGSYKIFSSLVKEETGFRSVQREKQRWLHVCSHSDHPCLARWTLHDAVPSLQKEGNSKKIEFANSIMNCWAISFAKLKFCGEAIPSEHSLFELHKKNKSPRRNTGGFCFYK